MIELTTRLIIPLAAVYLFAWATVPTEAFVVSAPAQLDFKMNAIIRPLSPTLGFDDHNQLWASWPDGEAICSAIVPDLREAKCCICQQGWELTGTDFRHHIRIHETDELAHTRCFVGHMALTEANMWYVILCDGNREKSPCGFIPWDWKKILNEYGGAWNTPWYQVSFKGYVPKLKLGSRRRVWNMALYDLREEQVKKGEELFAQVKDTKWADVYKNEVGVHAWTKEQAKQYIDWFRQIVRMDKPVDNNNAQIYEMDLPKKEEAAT
jgi:hypothetical protein